MTTINNNGFTARHHALVFTSIAKEIMNQTNKKNYEYLIRKAVRKYGEQRGKRMGLRALKNGHDLSVVNYFAYGEWLVNKGEMDMQFIEKSPDARLNIFKCPWYNVWKENNLLEYGRYFCREIDNALVRGFNPDLKIKIKSTQTNGANLCDFVFKDANINFIKMLGLIYKKKIKPGVNAVMPWDYHAGHLFKTIGEVIRPEFGSKTDNIMENALIDFSKFASKEHIRIIKSYKNMDFNRLP